MPRWFVYVNENQSEKHITIHPEATGPCVDIVPRIRKGGRDQGKFWIEVISSTETIKTGEVTNSYWLVIWAKNLNDLKNNGYLRREAQRLSIQGPELCEKCK
jgi:hypothetical protein